MMWARRAYPNCPDCEIAMIDRRTYSPSLSLSEGHKLDRDAIG